MTQEALKLALEALENSEYGDYDKEELNKAITALREALAEQPAQQEPVAWFSPLGNLYKTRFHATANGEQVITPLYTTPQRTWQGLTHEQVDSWELPDCPTVFEFAQFIEAKLKQKNGFAEEKNT